MRTYDVAVIGLGISGSAIASAIAERGKKVIGLERFPEGHRWGSSHGESRMLSDACLDHPDYVPLLRESAARWRDLDEKCSDAIILQSPLVTIGNPDRGLLQAVLANGDPAGAEVGGRWLARVCPWIRQSRDEAVVVDHDAAILRPERCVAAYQARAAAFGAELRFGAAASLGDENGARPRQVHVGGDTIAASQVVLAAGPWITKLLPDDYASAFVVERIPVFWLTPRSYGTEFRYPNSPMVIWDHPAQPFCLIPALSGDAVKIANHHSRDLVDPDTIDRCVAVHEVERVRRQLVDSIPLLNGSLARTDVCMYTTTPDGHFAIGPIGGGSTWLASACSGRGFKFAPVVGEIVADLVLQGHTRYRTELFAHDRPALLAHPDHTPAQTNPSQIPVDGRSAGGSSSASVGTRSYSTAK